MNNNNNKFMLDELGISPTYEHPRPYTSHPKMTQPINVMPSSSKNNKSNMMPSYNNFDPFNNMANNMNPPMPHNIQPNAYPQEKIRSYSTMSNNANQQQLNMNQQNTNFNNAQNVNLDQIKNWTAKNEEDLQIMSQKHEQLIGTILSEEEDVISSHRLHIDDMVELIKQVNYS